MYKTCYIGEFYSTLTRAGSMYHASKKQFSTNNLFEKQGKSEGAE